MEKEFYKESYINLIKTIKKRREELIKNMDSQEDDFQLGMSTGREEFMTELLLEMYENITFTDDENEF